MSLFAQENWLHQTAPHNPKIGDAEWDEGWISYNGRYLIVPEVGFDGTTYSLHDRTQAGRAMAGSESFEECCARCEDDTGRCAAIVSPDYFVHADDGSYPWAEDRVLWAWARTEEALTLALKAKGSHRLMLVVGIPGSGKTTWIKAADEPGTVYLDATLTRRSDRQSWARFADKLNKATYATVLLTPVNECMLRNASRGHDRAIPPQAMLRMKAQLLQNPVTGDDGIREVVVVRPSG
jgi:hypothetical protein